MTCEVELNLFAWNDPWTPGEFIGEYRSQVHARAELGMALLHPARSEEGELAIIFPSLDASDIMSETLTRWLAILGDVLESTERILTARQSAGSLVMRFDFPPQVQGACEQYLTYFAQFLRELGVEATTDLQHDETTVLFSVTPKEKEQALEQVWRALSIYLQLPSSPAFDLAASQSTDVRVQALSGMVQHYNSQLSYARATARVDQLALRTLEREVEVLEEEREGHRVTIADQRALIHQQARALESANLLLDSLQSVSKGGEVADKEEFFGVLGLGTMEEKGISINWAEAYRKVKRLISGKAEEGGGTAS